MQGEGIKVFAPWVRNITLVGDRFTLIVVKILTKIFMKYFVDRVRSTTI